MRLYALGIELVLIGGRDNALLLFVRQMRSMRLLHTPHKKLLSDFEFFDEVTITFNILLHKIVEH